MMRVTLRLGLNGLLQTPLSRLFVVLTISFILGLGTLLVNLMHSFSLTLNEVSSSYFITAYYKTTLTPDEETTIANAVEKWSEVRSVQVVSKESFLKNFARYFPQLSKDLSTLEADAIPRYMKIRVQEGDASTIQERLQKLSSVESVQTHEQRFSSLIEMLKVLKTFSFLMLTGALIALLCVLFNHFKLDSLHKSQVIKTITLLGGSRVHIALPFVFEGAIEGLVGSGISLMMLFLFKSRFDQTVATVFQKVGYTFQGYSLSSTTIVILLIGVLSGIFGSFWAIIFRRPNVS